MEVEVLGVADALEGSVLSIRAGSQRKQAAVSAIGRGNRPFTFPAGAGVNPFRIDLLKPAGSVRLALRPEEEASYAVEMKGAGKDGGSALVHFCVRGPGRGGQPPPPLVEAEILGEKGKAKAEAVTEPSKLGPMAGGDQEVQFQAAAASAKEYLEAHELMAFVRALLQTVVLQKPGNPFAYIAEQFRAAADAKEEAEKRPPPSGAPAAPADLAAELRAGELKRRAAAVLAGGVESGALDKALGLSPEAEAEQDAMPPEGTAEPPPPAPGAEKEKQERIVAEEEAMGLKQAPPADAAEPAEAEAAKAPEPAAGQQEADPGDAKQRILQALEAALGGSELDSARQAALEALSAALGLERAGPGERGPEEEDAKQAAVEALEAVFASQERELDAARRAASDALRAALGSAQAAPGGASQERELEEDSRRAAAQALEAALALQEGGASLEEAKRVAVEALRAALDLQQAARGGEGGEGLEEARTAAAEALEAALGGLEDARRAVAEALVAAIDLQQTPQGEGGGQGTELEEAKKAAVEALEAALAESGRELEDAREAVVGALAAASSRPRSVPPGRRRTNPEDKQATILALRAALGVDDEEARDASHEPVSPKQSQPGASEPSKELEEAKQAAMEALETALSQEDLELMDAKQTAVEALAAAMNPKQAPTAPPSEVEQEKSPEEAKQAAPAPPTEVEQEKSPEEAKQTALEALQAALNVEAPGEERDAKQKTTEALVAALNLKQTPPGDVEREKGPEESTQTASEAPKAASNLEQTTPEEMLIVRQKAAEALEVALNVEDSKQEALEALQAALGVEEDAPEELRVAKLKTAEALEAALALKQAPPGDVERGEGAEESAQAASQAQRAAAREQDAPSGAAGEESLEEAEALEVQSVKQKAVDALEAALNAEQHTNHSGEVAMMAPEEASSGEEKAKKATAEAPEAALASKPIEEDDLEDAEAQNLKQAPPSIVGDELEDIRKAATEALEAAFTPDLNVEQAPSGVAEGGQEPLKEDENLEQATSSDDVQASEVEDVKLKAVEALEAALQLDHLPSDDTDEEALPAAAAAPEQPPPAPGPPAAASEASGAQAKAASEAPSADHAEVQEVKARAREALAAALGSSEASEEPPPQPPAQEGSGSSSQGAAPPGATLFDRFAAEDEEDLTPEELEAAKMKSRESLNAILARMDAEEEVALKDPVVVDDVPQAERLEDKPEEAPLPSQQAPQPPRIAAPVMAAMEASAAPGPEAPSSPAQAPGLAKPAPPAPPAALEEAKPLVDAAVSRASRRTPPTSAGRGRRRSPSPGSRNLSPSPELRASAVLKQKIDTSKEEMVNVNSLLRQEVGQLSSSLAALERRRDALRRRQAPDAS